MMAVSLSEQVAPPADRVGLPVDSLTTIRAHRRVPWHVRFGLGWSSDAPPVILLLLVGMVLGPQALAVLTAPVLQSIDPALPVALAALGAHVALNLPISWSPGDRRLLSAAVFESVVTGVAVSGGVMLLLTSGGRSATFHSWLIALAAGICAATSSALPSDRSSEVQTPAVRARNMDVLLPIIAGGLLLAWIREGAIGDAAWLALQGVLVSVVIAVAAWLLLAKTSSETEQRILSAAGLLLVGGLADYLSLSAVLSGLVAGAFWRVAGGLARESLRRDISYLLHPLLVLMLVVAGARTAIDLPTLGLIALYPVMRAAGKLVGGWSARRATRLAMSEGFGSELIYPGLFGIAFAMNTIRSVGPQSDALLAVVVIGTVATQLAGALRRRPEYEA
jgi:hypothetical protein